MYNWINPSEFVIARFFKKLLYLPTLLSIFIIYPVFSQNEPDTSGKEKSVFDESRSKFDSLWNQSKDDYERFYQSEQESFDAYREKVENIWGEYVGSTKKNWVEYSEEQTTRTIVDFESGEATVEVLMESPDVQNQDLVKQRLVTGIEDLITSKGKSKDYDSPEESAVTLSEQPVLSGQLQNKSGELVSTSNAEEFTKEIVENSTIQYLPITGKDFKERVVVSVNFSLAPNHIRIRAEKYANLIEKYCNRYDLPQNLVFAIMHTESYFNPKAISSAPAYGLMQLVPSSGGKDAFQFVYGKDELVTPNYLYDPEKNIELGTAYLYLLLNRFFNEVEDIKSRTYCAIAGYNTGPGNVSKTFVGSKNISSATRKINTMTASKVYQHMRSNLPYSETRKYIEKVTQRMDSYGSWISKSD